MGQSEPISLAHRFSAWLHQARRCHATLRHLTQTASMIETPGDGTVVVRVPVAAWNAVLTEAAGAPPEPLDGTEPSPNGSALPKTTGHDNAPATRATG